MFERTHKYEAVAIDEAFEGQDHDFELRAEDEGDIVYVELSRKDLKKLKKEIGRLLDKTKGSN